MQGYVGAHIGSRPLFGKVFRQGFYWLKAASDAAELVHVGHLFSNAMS